MNTNYNPAGIYAITNTLTGKVYIGSSQRVFTRWGVHRSLLRRGIHANQLLQRSWEKHGEAAFAFDLLETTEVISDTHLLVLEQRFIEAFRTAEREYGYNLAPVAGTTRGTKRSPEVIEFLASKRRGTKASDETRKRMSDSRKGVSKSDATRQRMSDAQRGQKRSEPAREAMRQAQLSLDKKKEKHPRWIENPTSKQLKARLKRDKQTQRRVLKANGVELPPQQHPKNENPHPKLARRHQLDEWHKLCEQAAALGIAPPPPPPDFRIRILNPTPEQLRRREAQRRYRNKGLVETTP